MEPGDKFGKLTVLRITDEYRGSARLIECECDCGTVKLIAMQDLANGKSKSCGLCKGGLVKVGNSYGMLTVTGETRDPNTNRIWYICNCSCGTIGVLRQKPAITKTPIPNCGCLTKAKVKTFITEKLGRSTQKQKSKPGDVVNDITLLEILEYDRQKELTYGMFKCHCDKEFRHDLTTFRKGRIKSCGCLFKRRGNITHGLSKHPLYVHWTAMHHRVKNDIHYKDITIDPVFDTIEGFIANCPEGYRAGLTLDRIDGTKGYTPGNLRWATPLQQVNNRSVTITINDYQTGEDLLLKDFCDKYDLPQHVVYQRHARGLTGEQIAKPLVKKLYTDPATGEKLRVSELALRYNISPTRITNGVRRGMDMELILKGSNRKSPNALKGDLNDPKWVAKIQEWRKSVDTIGIKLTVVKYDLPRGFVIKLKERRIWADIPDLP